MRIYAMLNPNDENKSHYFEHGKYKTDYLNVRSFKLYADGALGSRGACLIEPYNDKPAHHGFLLSSIEFLQGFAKDLYENTCPQIANVLSHETRNGKIECLKYLCKKKYPGYKNYVDRLRI